MINFLKLQSPCDWTNPVLEEKDARAVIAMTSPASDVTSLTIEATDFYEEDFFIDRESASVVTTNSVTLSP